MIKFKRLKPDAQIPQIATAGDAGFDLHAYCPTYQENRDAESDAFLYHGEANGRLRLFIGNENGDNPVIQAIPTGIAVEIPEGFVGFICPRSGASLKNGRTIVNAPGVIDSSYRGELKVILWSLKPDYISHGDRIGQLVIVPCLTHPVKRVDELSDSTRGEKGFGSTGE